MIFIFGDVFRMCYVKGRVPFTHFKPSRNFCFTGRAPFWWESLSNLNYYFHISTVIFAIISHSHKKQSSQFKNRHKYLESSGVFDIRELLRNKRAFGVSEAWIWRLWNKNVAVMVDILRCRKHA